MCDMCVAHNEECFSNEKYSPSVFWQSKENVKKRNRLMPIKQYVSLAIESKNYLQ